MNSLPLLRLPALAALVCLFHLAGCARQQSVSSTQPIQWSALGASFALPPGDWQIREVEEDSAFSLISTTPPRRLALMRIPARADEAESIALRRLFAAFPEKKLRREWKHAFPSGASALCAEYDVREDGVAVPVRACIMRRGTWFYELIEWQWAATPALEAILDTLELGAGNGRTGGPP